MRQIQADTLFTDNTDPVVATLYGEPLKDCPEGLYIPPEALRVFLESFEGPLDLLLYLIRKQKFDVMDIPMATLTDQYMQYVEVIRQSNLELAAAYLVMSATLMQIKSRLLLPAPPREGEHEPEDPRAELMRRLLEYEKIREAAKTLNALPRIGRDFWSASAERLHPQDADLPYVTGQELSQAWQAFVARMKLTARHKIVRQELSVREHMSAVLKRLMSEKTVSFADLCGPDCDRENMTVWFLALLELAKDELVELTQAGSYKMIYVSRPKTAQPALFEAS